MADPFIIPVFLVSLWIAASFVYELYRENKPIEVEYSAAIEAVKLIKDWGVWMTTIATAAIAANGILIDGTTGAARSVYSSISIFSFAGSVLLDAWLIGCLPSIVLGLKPGSTHFDHDIYERSLFRFLPNRIFRVGFVGNIQHALFVIAVYALAVSAYSAQIGKAHG